MTERHTAPYLYIICILTILLNSCGNTKDFSINEFLKPPAPAPAPPPEPTPTPPPAPTIYLYSNKVDFIKGYEDKTRIFWYIYNADSAILKIENTISGKVESQLPIAREGDFRFFVDSPKRATIEASGIGGTSVKSIVFNIYDNPTIVDYLVVYNYTGANYNQNRITRFADGVVYVYDAAGVPHLELALEAWNRVVGHAITLRLTTNPTEAHIDIVVNADVVGPYAGMGGHKQLDGNTILKGGVWLHPDYKTARVAMHEIGHALGFFGHTFDGGVMGGNSTGEIISEIGYITEPVMRLLYSYPPGTDVETIRREYKK